MRYLLPGGCAEPIDILTPSHRLARPAVTATRVLRLEMSGEGISESPVLFTTPEELDLHVVAQHSVGIAQHELLGVGMEVALLVYSDGHTRPIG